MKPRFDAPVKQAVILAAGIGSRLFPLTADRPKAMVDMLEGPALHRTLRQLRRAGLERVVVVVGYEADYVVRETGHIFEGLSIEYVRNELFRETGTAASLLATAHALGEPSLVIEGDVLFEQKLLERLLSNLPGEEVAAISPFVPPLSGTAVTLEGNKISSFTRGVPQGQRPGLFKTVNLFRFSADTLRQVLTPALSRRVDSDPKAYLEDVLGDLVATGRLALVALHCGDMKWFEVDDEPDLVHARAMFREQPNQ